MMKPLPKVEKAIGGALTKIERVKKIVVSASLAVGIGLASGITNNAGAFVEEANQIPLNAGAVIMLEQSTANGIDSVAYHQSHRSHYSHQSHRSHYSHYSSSY
jgi:hypothetical protein